MIKELKIVAAQFSNQKQRYHFEFVWDRDRLWIVQLDAVASVRGKKPASAMNTLDRKHLDFKPSVLVMALAAKGPWNKIGAVKTFKKLRLPVSKLYVLENPAAIQMLGDGSVTTKLKRDLKNLLSAPIVIRTDVAPKAFQDNMLLPRTDCVTEINEAEHFLISKAAELFARGLKPDQICFIFHRFLSANACAQALANPASRRVRIDATWGLPDGLQYFPHDTYEQDIERPAKCNKKIRCKTHYFDVDTTGKWLTRETHAPWDWTETLSSSQRFELAKAAHKIACHMRASVDVMFFLDVCPSSGHPSWLPWIYLKEPIPPARTSSRIRWSRRIHTIRSKSDLSRLASDLSIGKRKDVLLLRPDSEHVRDREFLELIAKFAIDKNIPLELEGSVLSHAYYVLGKAGAKVACVDFYEGPRRIRKIQKLVRDFIPLIVQQKGEEAKVIQLSPADIAPLLKEKLVEEALETLAATDPINVIEELADVLEVLTSLAKVHGFTYADVSSAMKKKREQRGGFEKGLYLVDTREESLFSSAELGLFGAQPRSLAIRKGVPQRGRKAGFQKQGEALTISLIPPAQTGKASANFILGGTDMSIRIQYGEKSVIVDLAPKAQTPAESDQMMFKFE